MMISQHAGHSKTGMDDICECQNRELGAVSHRVGEEPCIPNLI